MHINIPDTTLYCAFDKNQIGQIINNLIINAKQSPLPFAFVVKMDQKCLVTTIQEGSDKVDLKKKYLTKLTCISTQKKIPPVRLFQALQV